MNLIKSIVSLLLLIYVGISCTKAEKIDENKESTLKLWYDEPAETWNEALPLGNGRLGAMVYGVPEKEHIQLNEETFWAGEPGNNVLPELKEILPELRKLIFSGKHKEAEALAMTAIPRHAGEGNNYGMPYQTIGDLYLDFSNHQNVQDYYRDLDIGNAMATVSYKANGVAYKREIFTSLVDDVIVIRLTADKPNAISFNVGADSPQKIFDVEVANNQLVLTGKSGSVDNKEGKVKFKGLVEIKAKNGEMTKKNHSIGVTQADEAIVYISLGTNFKNFRELSEKVNDEVSKKLEKAVSKDYRDAKSEHISKYQKYFNRVSLDLGKTDSINKPTDERLKEFANANDPAMVSLYFQYGRYLLISSSQPGGQPANLHLE